MRKGIGRFDGSIQTMAYSFIITLFSFPIGFFLSSQNPEFAHMSVANSVIRTASITAANCVVMLGLMYIIARALKKTSELPKWITITNWLSVPAFLLMLPLLVELYTKFHTWSEVYPFLLVIMIYQVACEAFVAANVLRISWMLGTAYALFGLVIADFITRLWN